MITVFNQDMKSVDNIRSFLRIFDKNQYFDDGQRDFITLCGRSVSTARVAQNQRTAEDSQTEKDWCIFGIALQETVTDELSDYETRFELALPHKAEQS